MCKYDWNKLLCDKRQRDSENGSGLLIMGRNEFDKDYERVIPSSAVRRLQDKTQVFPLQEDDIVRTRLTHSYEVSSLARSMGFQIGYWLMQEKDVNIADCNTKLASILATSGLVHDLGNPPFGHYGETIIRKWFEDWSQHSSTFNLSDKLKSDFLNFEGNAQSLRIVSKLQFMGDLYGLNFTYATLASMIKYPWSSLEMGKNGANSDKFGYFLSERKIVEKIYENTGTGMDFKKNPLALVLEAADDIAYRLGDIEDGVKKCVIDWDKEYEYLVGKYNAHEKLKSIFEHINNKKENICSGCDDSLIRDVSVHYFKVCVQSLFIKEAINNFKSNYEDIMMNEYNQSDLLGEDLSEFIKDLKEITKKYCFTSSEVMKLELAGEHILGTLLNLFADALMNSNEAHKTQHDEKIGKLISANIKYINCHDMICIEGFSADDVKLYGKLQMVLDYISGMTDSYARNLCAELIGNRLPRK